MSSTATVETREVLAPLVGSYVLSDMSVQLGRVPEDDPMYPHIQALMTVVDVMLRD